VRSLVSEVSAGFQQLREMMAERDLSVDHVTIWRWVQRYAPELALTPGNSWKIGAD
jgi:transposase-like protein